MWLVSRNALGPGWGGRSFSLFGTQFLCFLEENIAFCLSVSLPTAGSPGHPDWEGDAPVLWPLTNIPNVLCDNSPQGFCVLA